jgi:hypothetical protein
MPHRSTDSKSFGVVVNHWNLLGMGLLANAADLPHLEAHRLQLANLVSQANDLLSEQKIQAASKQDVTRQIETVLDQGLKLASFLRLGVKQHYGTRSEKLVEFDLLPFRGSPQPVPAPAPDPPVVPEAQKIKDPVVN